jgi:hypothetical protein
MAPSLVAAAQELRKRLAGFEPSLHSGADCGAHRQRGFLDPEEWLARAAGSSTPEARAALETASRLDDCPQTSEALLRGELSLAQAKEITRTETERPGSEAELLQVARNESLGTLKEQARQRRHEGVDPAV